MCHIVSTNDGLRRKKVRDAVEYANKKNTQKKKVFISGKVTGCDDYIEKFKNAENALKEKYPDKIIINAIAMLDSVNATEWDHDDCMDVTLALLSVCDEIVMLPDYSDSEGAIKEYRKATSLGLKVIFYESMFGDK